VNTQGKLTAKHADTLTRAITELRAAGTPRPSATTHAPTVTFFGVRLR
jgi:hypothetical protein